MKFFLKNKFNQIVGVDVYIDPHKFIAVNRADVGISPYIAYKIFFAKFLFDFLRQGCRTA